MDFKAALAKLKRSPLGGRATFLVIQPDAVYVSSSAKSCKAERFEVVDSDWEAAFEQALSVIGSSSDVLTVVLANQYYQMYQIDKPAMPRNEWPSALPYLLKELISERAVDIVADAVELPNSNKVQAYVLSRKVFDTILRLTNQTQISLESIVPEDDLWGDCADELGNFLLLQRSARGPFRISAFVDHVIAFHRSIRSVTPPLTGVPSSDVQMDNLSLELQRSIDYLSSQLRSVQLHQLKICCDEEDTQELIESLNIRLSSKASPLKSEGCLYSGYVLAEQAAHSQSRRVNLYPDFLKQKKHFLTLKNVAIIWGATAASMALSYGYFSWKSEGTADAVTIAQSHGEILKSELERNQKKLRQHKPDRQKLAMKLRLENEIKAKRDSLKAVDRFGDSLELGYSGVMKALAKLGNGDISLAEIVINDEQSLALKGLARSPSDVPNWISQFKNEASLVEQTFDDVSIGRNKDNVVTFALKTTGGNNSD
ncbi:MSHA biogenesis protein MshI [Vibrio azureus]|uniref:MSHA biogenesis protein MshI n=1 Tax=Vibrio azureus NBRC 104587 TaxID=1219077 RepID=U3A671_9VIBR|nr:hypothetical protein [Vibrio azureus]AUI87085.1 MSHA biogenesis protein MshI [Vibrio azureus]GAD75506.1 hypothetical protein VAZ01S_026_00120 [Vibrio azureus NBRC 104587]